MAKIQEPDATTILEYFNKKYRRIPFIKISVKRFAREIPECAKKYTVGEVVELLCEHYD